jgi:hypothetical protein
MTANKLMVAVMDKKCVTGFHTASLFVGKPHPMPAAFLVGMPFRLVMNVLPRLKIYKPKRKL